MENNKETVEKLQNTLASREKQIASMATMLAELNEKLNDSLIKNRTLTTENKELNTKLVSREDILKQELKDKELIFSKLQTLERENERLNDKISSFQGKGGKKAQDQKSTKPTVIETTHGKIKPNVNNNTSANIIPSSQQVSNNKFEASPSLQFQKQDSSSDSEVGTVLKFLMTKIE